MRYTSRERSGRLLGAQSREELQRDSEDGWPRGAMVQRDLPGLYSYRTWKGVDGHRGEATTVTASQGKT